MYISGSVFRPARSHEETKGTFWCCEPCHSVVSICCTGVVDQAMCPTCGEALEKFCGVMNKSLRDFPLDS